MLFWLWMQLPLIIKKIALAYDFQVLKEKIPDLAKDAKIDKIITEERIIQTAVNSK